MAKQLATAAIIYDFDGTLAPGNMQEHQFLPDVGITPNDFWSEVIQTAQTQQADEVLMYMNLMLRKAEEANVPVRRADFNQLGKSIKLFPGVENWFDRINTYGKSVGVNIEHYLISSGNTEIFEGTKIAPKFKKAYASKFMYDGNGVAIWPALAINYTTKTQYLFRINKDAHNLGERKLVNKFIPKEERPVPFENMIFIGDGDTDVPCFRLVKDQGGLSVAVFDQTSPILEKQAKSYLEDNRVNLIAPADYRTGKRLESIIQIRLDQIALIAKLQSI